MYLFPSQPAAIDPPMFASPMIEMAIAPSAEVVVIPMAASAPLGLIAPQTSVDEGREMRGDEAKLIAAGKEANEDQRIARVAEGADQDRAQRLLQLLLRCRCTGARISGSASSDSRIAPAKIRKTVCQG